jgi:Spy/CpxP family protein refolding chaperone
MKFSRKIAIGTAAALGLAAAVVIAQPGQMGGAMGMHGPMAGMQHGQMGGMGQGRMGGQPLMTPEERSAFQEKMRNAKTPEERQKLVEANRTEMQKRAKEKGITLPQPHGPRAGFGPHFAPETK